MTKYKVYKIGTPSISKVEVVRETKGNVYIYDKFYEKKSSTYHEYFDTFEEARKGCIDYLNSLIQKYTMQLQTIQERIDSCKKDIETFKVAEEDNDGCNPFGQFEIV